MRERLQQMETDFRSTRQQQQQPQQPPQQQYGYQQQQQQYAAGSKERGAGDWANYQPPSAVLAAVQQRQQQQQYAQPPGPPTAPVAAAPPAAAAAPASSLPIKKDLPPALKARLAARGILPKEEGAAGSSGSGSSGSEGDCLSLLSWPARLPSCAVLHALLQPRRTQLNHLLPLCPLPTLLLRCRSAAAGLAGSHRPHLPNRLLLQCSNRGAQLDAPCCGGE
jgi:hypothetical protein